MSRHILAIRLDDREQKRLDAGELIFPEHIDSHDHSVMCPSDNGCSGWLKCHEPHEVDGKSAKCGPYDCSCPDEQPSCLGDEPDEGDRPRPPWHDEEDFEFHGVMHTWRYGHGWTVPFTGHCIVAWADYELPDDYEQLPLGEYNVDDDWEDTSCYLTLAGEPTK